MIIIFLYPGLITPLLLSTLKYLASLCILAQVTLVLSVLIPVGIVIQMECILNAPVALIAT